MEGRERVREGKDKERDEGMGKEGEREEGERRRKEERRPPLHVSLV